MSDLTDFVALEGFSGRYLIHPDGRIWAVKQEGRGGHNTDRPVKSFPDAKGYIRICLRTDAGRRATYKLHQLVARTFVPNPFGLPEPNHKDRNKANNHKDNLEWSTRKANLLHAQETGLRENSSSSFYGVDYCPRPNRRKHWRARILRARKQVHIGLFLTEVEAAQAYNHYVTRHGISALLNPISQPAS